MLDRNELLWRPNQMINGYLFTLGVVTLNGNGEPSTRYKRTMKSRFSRSSISVATWTGAVVVLGTVSLFVVSMLNQPEEIAAYSEERVLRSAQQDGITYKLSDDGNVFRVIDERGTWTWVDRIFDPEQISRQFVREGESLLYVDIESGKRYPLSKHFAEGFEEIPVGVEGLRSLIGEERKWTEFTLQTPETPNVADYVALRKRILQENGNFLDAVVAPSQHQAHSGHQSLHCVCPAKTSQMICTKASLGTSLIGFEQGDDLWIQAWYLVDGATRPFTLADIEGRHVKESPGIRLMLFEGLYLGVELKAIHKPKYQQPEDKRVLFPLNQWVQVTLHVYLHPDDGHVHIWQNETLLVDEQGPTLPFAGMLYHSLEVGISAHAYGDEQSQLFVDDLLVTTTPLRDIPSLE
jgi:hypothetical protein